LFKGDVKKVEGRFSSEELKRCIELRFITICDFNKKIFKQDEKVELYVELKNIQTLQLKVFEIQTENYYKKHGREVE
jgi:hypothetical protein